eukprot:15458896-Alexandrium_andersonii.AAC.1
MCIRDSISASVPRHAGALQGASEKAGRICARVTSALTHSSACERLGGAALVSALQRDSARQRSRRSTQHQC